MLFDKIRDNSPLRYNYIINYFRPLVFIMTISKFSQANL